MPDLPTPPNAQQRCHGWHMADSRRVVIAGHCLSRSSAIDRRTKGCGGTFVTFVMPRGIFAGHLRQKEGSIHRAAQRWTRTCRSSWVSRAAEPFLRVALRCRCKPSGDLVSSLAELGKAQCASPPGSRTSRLSSISRDWLMTVDIHLRKRSLR